MIVRQMTDGAFAIGRLAAGKGRGGIVFVPRDDVRYQTRAEALAALEAENEGRK